MIASVLVFMSSGGRAVGGLKTGRATIAAFVGEPGNKERSTSDRDDVDETKSSTGSAGRFVGDFDAVFLFDFADPITGASLKGGVLNVLSDIVRAFVGVEQPEASVPAFAE